MNVAKTQRAASPAKHVNAAGLCMEEINLPGTGTFALIRLSGSTAHKPATFGPKSLRLLGTVLEDLRTRAAAGEFVGIGVTGQDRFFVAGADLKAMRAMKDPDSARMMGRLGHQVLGTLAAIGVPTFAFINGAAVGGGLEIALAASYRTISTGALGISLPEAYLGLVPGWGGVYRLPRLVGPQNAVKMMIENPLSNNKSLDGPSAFEMGIADVMFESGDFLNQSLAWASRILAADVPIRVELEERRARKASFTRADWDDAVTTGRAVVALKTSNAVPAPTRVLELLERGRDLSETESAELEIEALTELIQTTQFKNSVYALLDVIQRRSKIPARAASTELARPIEHVGVIGAGLMAGQLALLFARQLQVPVVLTDIDQARLDRGVRYVHNEVDKLLAKRRITLKAAEHLKSLVSGAPSRTAFADADFVIEAVFEEMSVKKTVFSQIEAVVSEDCILATNTSSLSVAEMASDLLHPERVIGFHFFNPVAAMPLVEIVQTPKTNDETVATAFVLGKALGKTGVLVQDAAAFVVNRLLLRLMGEVSKAFDDGTPAEIADNALRSMGLPMTPFTLLAMIGMPVSQHVTESLHAAFGDRFRVSPNQQKLIENGISALWVTDDDGNRYIPQSTLNLCEFSDSPSTSEQLLARVQDALAQEIRLILDEGVVSSPEDVDLCMIAGAGWPLHLGGITPYLDHVGASDRATGQRFHVSTQCEST
jgi:3-hydroxyacyl-CoA dehydrogenase/enoyl-CoA hydratase/carnithine racemase